MLRVPSILALAVLLGLCLESMPSFAQAVPETEWRFGDGSVAIVATPGHTPGHQSLLVRLPKTGTLLRPGDAVHFKDGWETRRVPESNNDKDRGAALLRTADLPAKEEAQLWINHDNARRDSQGIAPAFYE